MTTEKDLIKKDVNNLIDSLTKKFAFAGMGGVAGLIVGFGAASPNAEPSIAACSTAAMAFIYQSCREENLHPSLQVIFSSTTAGIAYGALSQNVDYGIHVGIQNLIVWSCVSGIVHLLKNVDKEAQNQPSP